MSGASNSVTDANERTECPSIGGHRSNGVFSSYSCAARRAASADRNTWNLPGSNMYGVSGVLPIFHQARAKDISSLVGVDIPHRAIIARTRA